ncbi:DNA/RNA helicase domain-containing protein [Nocardiopsis quinghaiensis]|uniref:DNA/RNA helicase domain-containing protein n=1 Tax=Nocardiopsis quinghaiensis TaxID=464995 RepID=UPI0012393D10|nr:DNA/RNA helicase domain-containing protein [Nocardiopsis quinghaiensis]
MPETAPTTSLLHIHAATVSDTLSELDRPGFFEECRERYRAAGFGEPSTAEFRSWRMSWKPLVEALAKAGLGDLWLYLECSAADGASRFDALLLGKRSDTRLVAAVVELKQWTDVKVLSKYLVRLRFPDGSTDEALNPVAQVGGYVHFLRRRFSHDSFDLESRGVVFLHNATAQQVSDLTTDPDAEFPIVSGQEADESPGGVELARLLRVVGISAPAPSDVEAFEAADWSINQSLLDKLSDTLRNNTRFALVGGQQKAYVAVRHAVETALQQRQRQVVLVKGGPGSGKTVLAVQLLAFFLSRGTKPRYITPSGTLVKQLRSESGDILYHDYFQLPGSVVKDSLIVLFDEVHRLKRAGGGFARHLGTHFRNVPVVVAFLDERQIVRPDEGVTEKEVLAAARAEGARVVTYDLAGNFRCSGSRSFATWVDDLLYGVPRRWEGPDYDLGVAENPSELELWLEDCLSRRRVPRISAGFCWPWKKVKVKPPLPEVRIEWRHGQNGSPQVWKRPWNLNFVLRDDHGEEIAPESQMWATQSGGENQIGCVYTAQGLEYDDAGVILGPDFVWRDDRWQADPGHSEDWVMRDTTREQYLTYARNIYRVLMTRGMGSCRLYSTDEETQEFLTSLMPKARA